MKHESEFIDVDWTPHGMAVLLEGSTKHLREFSRGSISTNYFDGGTYPRDRSPNEKQTAFHGRAGHAARPQRRRIRL